ncbi:cytochrome b [Thalassotalea sp. Y01]|uniref:cytochrome b n=1 Tax=Thalassotalea sp. Y01 TaxID=2729613 RepID=UPI00145E84ED|nr:cytochrome b [Thalassotalea sp. Y01]NMP17485.1 cytochrome b [Thalassotalea sp. Y01]
MNTKQSQQAYPTVAKLMHWLTAVVVFALFGVGLWMVELDYYSSWYRTAPTYHKSVGILLALLIVLRMVYKYLKPAVQPIESHSKMVKISAKATHFILYVLLLTLFASGYLISTADGRGIEVFDWFVIPSLGQLFSNQEDIAGTIHEYVAYSLIVLVVLHGAAAIKHHVIDKDDTLKRML